LILLTKIVICSGQNIVDSSENKLKHNQLPEKWNIKLFENDKKWIKDQKTVPLNSLAFPVDSYEDYVVSKPFTFKVTDAHFSGISFGKYYLQSTEKPVSKEKFDDYIFKLKEDKRIFEMGKEIITAIKTICIHSSDSSFTILYP
jgi:hypothetical protein